jgi:hypothetical protein
MTEQERSLDEQVSWLCKAQRNREASIRRHVANAAAGTDWAAVARGIPGEAPGWITDAAKREYLRGLGQT